MKELVFHSELSWEEIEKNFEGVNVGNEIIAALEEVRDMVKKEKREGLEKDKNTENS